MTKEYLITQLQNEMDGLVSPVLVDYHQAWADVLNTEFDAVLTLDGAYVGTIPGPSPDPLNGTYTWEFTNWTATGAGLLAGITGGSGSGVEDWLNSLETFWKVVQTDTTDQTVTITAISITLVNLNFTLTDIILGDVHDGLTGEQIRALTWSDYYNVITQYLIDDMDGIVSSNPTSPATSSGGGTGTVTWQTTIVN